jgi:hypothetical protein
MPDLLDPLASLTDDGAGQLERTTPQSTERDAQEKSKNICVRECGCCATLGFHRPWWVRQTEYVICQTHSTGVRESAGFRSGLVLD